MPSTIAALEWVGPQVIGVLESNGQLRFLRLDQGGQVFGQVSLVVVSTLDLSGFDLVDVDNFIRVEDDHMNRLFGTLREVPENRFRHLAEVELISEKGTQLHEFKAQKVVLRLSALADVAKIRE